MSTTTERLLPESSDPVPPDPYHAADMAATGDHFQSETARLEVLETCDPQGAAFAYIDHATIFLHEGKHYLKFRFHPMTFLQRKHFRSLHFSRYNWVKLVEVVVATILLLLTLFEPPAVYPWPSYATVPIELLCVAFFVWDVHHRSQAAGGYKVRWAHGRACLLSTPLQGLGLRLTRQYADYACCVDLAQSLRPCVASRRCGGFDARHHHRLGNRGSDSSSAHGPFASFWTSSRPSLRLEYCSFALSS